MELADEKSDFQSVAEPSGGIAALAAQIMDALAQRFPVCMASDEFHFFPQARAEDPDWSCWDDFSADAIADLKYRAGLWQKLLTHCRASDPDPATAVDTELLLGVLKTLVEQLTLVCPQRSQPTFYLTMMGIGLSEALDYGVQAWGARLRGLPGFIRQARRNLQEVPRRFGRMGLEMLSKQIAWLKSLAPPRDLLQPALAALSELETFLRALPGNDAYLLDKGLYEHVASTHMGCALKPQAIAEAIQAELEETLEILTSEARRLSPGQPWPAMFKGLPRQKAPCAGVHEIYRQTIDQLSRHCVQHGFMTSGDASAWPVKIEMIPDFMRPVRSNAAFSAPPGHPPKGGTFYLLPAGNAGRLPADHRLLTAHETYPGHHLLDSRRWGLARVARRHVEFPIFYEGWASFAEELLFETGFFKGPVDRLLMAKRRYGRAMRGRVDLEIHTRRRSLDQAAALLSGAGIKPHRARAMVRRYVLKPGYQLAYTIGRRRFRRLYDQYRNTGQGPAAFARRVLDQGEIPFDTLAQLLSQGG